MTDVGCGGHRGNTRASRVTHVAGARAAPLRLSTVVSVPCFDVGSPITASEKGLLSPSLRRRPPVRFRAVSAVRAIGHECPHWRRFRGA